MRSLVVVCPMCVAWTPVQGAWSQVYMYTTLKGSVGLFGLFFYERIFKFSVFIVLIRNFILLVFLLDFYVILDDLL